MRFFAADLVDVGQNPLHGTELGNQVRRRLLADSRHTGNVVHAIAGKPQDIHHLFRTYAETLPNLRDADVQLLPRVEDRYLVRNQLHQIFVAGHQGDGVPFPFQLPGKTSQQIVRLVTRQFDHRQAKGPNHLPNQGELGNQIVGRIGPVGFVRRIEFGTETDAGDIEHRTQVRGLFVGNQFQQHGREAEHGVGGDAFGIAHPLFDRMVGTKDVAGDIQKENARVLDHRSMPSIKVTRLKKARQTSETHRPDRHLTEIPLGKSVRRWVRNRAISLPVP